MYVGTYILQSILRSQTIVPVDILCTAFASIQLVYARFEIFTLICTANDRLLVNT